MFAVSILCVNGCVQIVFTLFDRGNTPISMEGQMIYSEFILTVSVIFNFQFIIHTVFVMIYECFLSTEFSLFVDNVIVTYYI